MLRRRALWTAGALAFVLLLGAVPLAGAKGFQALTEYGVPEGGFAVHGSEVAWLRVEPDGVDLMLTNLTTMQARRVALVATSSQGFAAERLAFDGSWVAWSHAQGGPLEIFAVDVRDGAVRRLTENAVDDRELTLSGGVLVWSQVGRLLVQDLRGGSSAFLETGAAGAREPDLEDSSLVWVRVTARDRTLMRATLEGTTLVDASDLRNASGVSVAVPRQGGSAAAWAAQALAGSRIVPSVEAAGLANASLQSWAAGAQVTDVDTDGTRVVWSAGGRLWYAPVQGGGRIPLNASADGIEVTPNHVVAWTGSDGMGRLLVMDWEPRPRSEGLPALAVPGVVAVLLAGAVVARARRPP